MNIKSIVGAVCTGLAIISLNAGADNFSFTGTFAADNDVQLFDFTADGSSTIALRSYSYGGGIQADGNVVSEGGFDPILALFDNTGLLIGINDDDALGIVGTDSVTGFSWDTYLTTDLVAGDYIVAVMQYNNRPGTNTVGVTMLSDGFTYDDPFFTTTLGGCTNGQFCDTSGANRTNEWAFDVLNVETARVIPVPAAFWLFGSGLIGLIGVSRRNA